MALLLSLGAMAQDDTVESGPGVLGLGKKSFKAMEGHNETVEIIRNNGFDGEVSVRLRTVAGSATADEDFKAIDEVVTFANGERSKKLTLVIPKDGLELPEILHLELSEATGGATLEGVTDARVQIVTFNNDAIVLGLLMVMLALVFTTSHSDSPGWKKFYTFVPSLLMCYFLPSAMATLGLVSGEHSKLYFVASRYLLPACLVLLCLSIDLKGILGLGWKALVMFFTGTIGIVLGGPLAMLIWSKINPELIAGDGPNAVWRGMSTVAGSWIGGGANQTAMYETFNVGSQIFSATVTVDIIVANIWMAVILFLAGESDKVDAKLKADNSAIKALQKKMADYQSQLAKIPTLTDLMKLLGIAFACTAAGHLVADIMGPFISKNFPALKQYSLHSGFFWLIGIATALGLILSFTKLSKLEGVGASRVGSAFLYVLVASIGMKMDLTAIFEYPELFLIGMIWIAFHGILLFAVAKLIRAPLFFLAVGSQANVGGAASAPIVASAFHPTLAPVGVMLAVVGYFLGTYGAYLCGLVMRSIAN